MEEMAAPAAGAFMMIAVICCGVGVFLYNDGRDHQVAGWLMEGASGAALALGLLARQVAQDQHYDACREGLSDGAYYNPATGFGNTFDYGGCLSTPVPFNLFEEFFLETVLCLIAAGIGFLVAKVTRRKPTDGRRATLSRNDSGGAPVARMIER
jgi:hypothetical protein